ncbi:hypothetical protein Neosp_010225 [[Neocosmospora] mangrovei]
MSTEERQETATPPLQEALAENPLEADNARDDGDSAYAASENSASYQTSLASSIINYKYVLRSVINLKLI